MNADHGLVIVLAFFGGVLGVVMMIERGVGGGDVVMLGVLVMRVREMGVVTGEFVLAFGVMLVGGVVMPRGFLVMHGGERVMLGGGLGVFHGGLPVARGARAGPRMIRGGYRSVTGTRQWRVDPTNSTVPKRAPTVLAQSGESGPKKQISRRRRRARSRSMRRRSRI